jgi:hypothetical protein
MLIIGEFQPLSDEFSAIKSGIQEHEIMQKTVTQFPKYYLGRSTLLQLQQNGCEITEEISIMFEERPWQYTWVGNKHKTTVNHGFIVSFLTSRLSTVKRQCSTNLHKSTLVLVAQISSPSFRIKCVRKGSLHTRTQSREEVEQESTNVDKAGYNRSSSFTTSIAAYNGLSDNNNAPDSSDSEIDNLIINKRKSNKILNLKSVQVRQRINNDEDVETIYTEDVEARGLLYSGDLCNICPSILSPHQPIPMLWPTDHKDSLVQLQTRPTVGELEKHKNLLRVLFPNHVV